MDLLILERLNDLVGKSVFLDKLFIFSADYLGYVLLLAFVFLLVKNYKKYWRLIVVALISGIISRFVFTELIRLFYSKSRPFVDNNIHLLIPYQDVNSFPSGHAAFFFAISTVVFLYNKKAGLIFIFASFLITISRIIVGVHWPADIIAGALVGIVSSCIIVKIFKP